MATVRYTTVNGEIIAEKRNGVRRSYVPDPLGSTVALLDNTQAKTDTFTYWPYGEIRTRTGSTPTPFTFVGTLGYYGDTGGRVYIRSRIDIPNYGRWMTVDPFWPDQGQYSYCNASPTLSTDPTGAQATLVGTAVFPVVGTAVGGLIDIGLWIAAAVAAAAAAETARRLAVAAAAAAELARCKAKALDCADAYVRFTAECKGKKTTCGNLVAPRDCLKIATQLALGLACFRKQAWIVANCDIDPESIAGGWTPKLPGHWIAACDLLKAACNCAPKARACGYPAPSSAVCARMLKVCPP